MVSPEFRYRINKMAQARKRNLDVAVSTVKTAIHITRDHVALAFGVLPSERLDARRVEIGGRPFAFDRNGRLIPFGQNEIDLVSLFVAPVMNLSRLQVGVKLIQNEVFPEHAQILASEFMPAPIAADKARVETVDLGSRDDFR